MRVKVKIEGFVDLDDEDPGDNQKNLTNELYKAAADELLLEDVTVTVQKGE